MFLVEFWILCASVFLVHLPFIWGLVWSCCPRLLYHCLLLAHSLGALLLVARWSCEFFCQLHSLTPVRSIWHHFLTSIYWFSWCIPFLMLAISTVFSECGSVLYFVWGIALYFVSVMCCISYLVTLSISSAFFPSSSMFSHFIVRTWNSFQSARL